MKIVVTNNQDFTAEQKARLSALGEVEYYDDLPQSGEEYLRRVEGAAIICSGAAGFKDVYPQLKDVYVTFAFVSVAFITDFEVLKRNNVIVSNAPGANRHAVSEWVMGMMIYLTREFEQFINRRETYRRDGGLPPLTMGLATRNLTILGKGNIGARVGVLAGAFGMNVTYFTRGDNLYDSVKDADVVVDTLSNNPSTDGLLDADFFKAMKEGSYFVSVARRESLDQGALLAALDKGHLRGAAMDCANILVGDTEDPYYQTYLDHPKVVATPHVAYNTPLSMQTGGNIMIDNVEAYINGKPQNIVV